MSALKPYKRPEVKPLLDVREHVMRTGGGCVHFAGGNLPEEGAEIAGGFGESDWSPVTLRGPKLQAVEASTLDNVAGGATGAITVAQTGGGTAGWEGPDHGR